MGKFVITGATGQLGGLVVKHLIDMGTPAQNIAAVVRNEVKAAGLKNLGLEIRKGDYDQADTLKEAFQESDKLLFISSPSPDGTYRIRQHASVVEAARNAGVGHIIYTSLAFADKVTLGMENVHLATELAIKETKIPYTILRNTFYMDYFVNPLLKGIVDSGVIASASKGNKFNYVTRNDLALTAAIILKTDEHQNKVYELTNPKPITYDDFAEILSEISGKEVKHLELTPEQVYEQMIKQGFSQEDAGFYNYMWPLLAQGYFSYASDDLVNLIGNKFTSFKDAVQKIFKC